MNAASKVACMGVLLDDFNSATYVLNHHFEFGEPDDQTSLLAAAAARTYTDPKA